MKINWWLRLKNRATLTALAGVVIAAVYAVFAILGFVPAVGEDQVTNFATLLIALLVGLGVVVDPTTEGVSDSYRALNYSDPAKNVNTDERDDC